MRIRSLLVTMVGMAVAAASVYASRELVQPQPATAAVDPAAPALVSVVVAGQEIPFGTPIEAHKLTTIQWPADAVPPGTFRDFSTLVPEAGTQPRRAKRTISQGELVLANKISEFGEKVTIVQTLQPGYRAMAISVNATTSVAGFVTPGDIVDILLTTSDAKGLRVLTLLQKVRIIATDQISDETQEQAVVARTVTVEVTPEESQTLALARQAGSLSLTLRDNESNQQEEETPLDSLRLSDILLEESPGDAPKPKQVIKIRRAGDLTETEIEIQKDEDNAEQEATN